MVIPVFCIPYNKKIIMLSKMSLLFRQTRIKCFERRGGNLEIN